MTGPGTFDRVYAAIKKRLREGAFRPGDRLEPAALSDELNASVTPVRDALHRLTGERLVEAPRHEGFRSPMLSETLLRHLYAWHLDLLLLAVVKHRADALGGELAGESLEQVPPHEVQARLFLALARAAGNPEHVAVLEGLSNRLEPIQRLEEVLLGDLESETKEIVEALRLDDRRALRGSLLRYHRRRMRLVPDLFALLLQH